MSHKDRVFGLDLLRAFAIFFVVHDHGRHFLSWHPVLTYVVFDGVSFFFVLSGFLIGRILIRTITSEGFDGPMLVDFWIKRWCRTLPNFILILTTLTVAYSLMGKSISEFDLAYYFIFSQNLASPHPAFFPEAWSLAVEEWFYLMIPIPFFFAAKVKGADRKKLIVWAIGIVIGSVTAFRIYKAYHYGYISIQDWDLNIRKQVITRLDGLMYGVAGAYFSLYHFERWKARAPLLCFIGLALVLFDKLMSNNIFYLNYFNITVISLGTLMMLPYLSNWQRPHDLISRVVTFVSVISYSMYLVNLTLIQSVLYPFYKLACPDCATSSIPLYLMYWVATIACSSILYYCFERHMTKLRDRITIKRKVTKIDYPVVSSSEGFSTVHTPQDGLPVNK